MTTRHETRDDGTIPGDTVHQGDIFLRNSNVRSTRIGCTLVNVSRGATNPAARHRRLTLVRADNITQNLSPFVGRCMTKPGSGIPGENISATSDKGANSFIYWTALASAVNTYQSLNTSRMYLPMPQSILPVGLDAVSKLVMGHSDRIVFVNGEPCGSPIDVIAAFKGEIKNPRQYWKDHKKQLLSKDSSNRKADPDPELVANLYHLKMTTPDGKQRMTDVAPLWVCVYIAATINQQFRKSIAKFAAAEIKYRVLNIANGSEWAADSIREIIKDLPDIPNRELLWWQR